jgi:hypothetical protein
MLATVVSEISWPRLQSAPLNTVVTTGRVVTGHAQHEFNNLIRSGRPPHLLAAPTIVPFGSHQFPMPPKDGVRSHDRRQLLEHLTAEDLSFHSQPPPLIIVEENCSAYPLDREDDVADAGELRQRGPVLGVELPGVEGPGQFLGIALQVVGRGADEGVADDVADLAIDAPVDEEAEACVAESLQAVGAVPGSGRLGPRGEGRRQPGCDQRKSRSLCEPHNLPPR